MKLTFAERYVSKEAYGDLKKEMTDAILCLRSYRREGHLFCVKWIWDLRCANCKEADRVMEAWRERT